MNTPLLNAQPTRTRFTILAAVFVNVVINYMDRSNISVAAPFLVDEFQLSSVQLGLIFSAFGWTYAALQIPGGIMADRFGPRVVYTVTLIAWSVVTLLQGFAKGFATLFGLRLAIGVFEAPSYPTNNRIVTTWFPESERASAIATYTSGQYIGLAFLAPVLTALEHYAGWQGLFIITGAIGVIWGMAWYRVYRDPVAHRGVNKEELAYIEKGGGLVNRSHSAAARGKSPKFNWSDLGEVFVHRKLWGIYIGQFAIAGTLWFFLTWFPTYLVKYRGVSFLKSGFMASAPFLSAFAGILISGFLSDHMVRRKVPIDVARKLPVILGLLLSMAVVGANYVESPALIIFFMCVSFFGNGVASITWVFVSTLAPKHLVGLTGGVFNCIGNLSGIIVPIAIGWLARDGQFAPALIFVACLGLTGALSYIFLVGRVERIENAVNIAIVQHPEKL
jgi:ACS family D-galactonate transporter-like MFS transporter